MTPCFLYRFFDSEDRLLYVGISYHVEKRFDQHRSAKPWAQIARIAVASYPTRAEADRAEREAIATESPAWNVAHNLNRSSTDGASWWPMIEDGDWWWTRRFVPDFLCERCGKKFEDRPVVMRYVKEKDSLRTFRPGSQHSEWARLGWCLWLEHDDCGWAEHNLFIDEIEVRQLGVAGGGWNRWDPKP